jgi:hypothetical protein
MKTFMPMMYWSIIALNFGAHYSNIMMLIGWIAGTLNKNNIFIIPKSRNISDDIPDDINTKYEMPEKYYTDQINIKADSLRLNNLLFIPSAVISMITVTITND